MAVSFFGSSPLAVRVAIALSERQDHNSGNGSFRTIAMEAPTAWSMAGQAISQLPIKIRLLL
jgi:hypothetical protein